MSSPQEQVPNQALSQFMSPPMSPPTPLPMPGTLPPGPLPASGSAQPLLAQQAALVQWLFGQAGRSTEPAMAPETAVQAGVANSPYAKSDRGLKAYQSNGRMLAERVLAAAYPVVTAIISAPSMGQLARALWQAHPPERGDLAHWGHALPGFIAASPQLAALPWLADVARVEWALHQAESAADAWPDPATFSRLVEQDPAELTLSLAPGLQLVATSWCVVPVLQAHRHATDPAQAIAALGEEWCAPGPAHALVWRRGFEPQLGAVSPPEVGLMGALQSGQPLLAALEQSDLDFAAWLPTALEQGWVLGVEAWRPAQCVA